MARTYYDMSEVGLVRVAAADIGQVAAPTDGSSGTVDICILPANCLVLRTICKVTTGFNDTGASLLVGTVAVDDALLAAADITEATPAFYEKATPVKLQTTDNTTIRVKYSATTKHETPTGKATVYVEFVRLQP